MVIEFECVTNKEYVMINYATFLLPDCITTVSIDRDTTEYSIDEIPGENLYSLSMRWECCYLWEIDGECIFDSPAYLNSDGAKYIDTGKFVRLDLEDDADKDYFVQVLDYCIC